MYDIELLKTESVGITKQVIGTLLCNSLMFHTVPVRRVFYHIPAVFRNRVEGQYIGNFAIVFLKICSVVTAPVTSAFLISN